MKKILLFCFLFCVWATSFGQERKDSLEIAFKNKRLLELRESKEKGDKISIIVELVKSSQGDELEDFYQKGKQIAGQNQQWLHDIEMAKGYAFFFQNKRQVAIDYHYNYWQKNKDITREQEADIFIVLAEIYKLDGQFEKMKPFAIKAKGIADSLQLRDKSAKAAHLLAQSYRDTGKPDSSLVYLAEAEKQLTSSSNAELISIVHNTSGRVYRMLGDYPKASVYYKKALDIALDHKITHLLGALYNNLGNTHHSQGDLENALKYYIQALDIKQKEGNKNKLSIAYHNLGAIRLDLKNYKLAQEDFYKSLELAEEVNYKRIIYYNILKIGSIYRIQSQVDSALVYHTKANSIAKGMNFQLGICNSYLEKGKDYQQMGLYAKALEQFKASLLIARNIQSKSSISNVLAEIANTYILIDDSARLNEYADYPHHEDTESLLLESAKIAKKINNRENIETALSALRKFYAFKKNPIKEAQVSREYIAFKDSLFNEQKAEAISEWETKYKTAEQEKEIVLLQKEKELQTIQSKNTRNRFIGILLFLCLAAILFFTRQYYRHKVAQNQQKETLRMKISMDLHDDVGSLLTGLAMQTEILEYTTPEETDKKKLAHIAELSRSAMSRMRDAVWAMDSQRDNWESLIDRMNEFASEFLLPQNIAFNIQSKGLPHQQKLSGDFRQNVYLIYKEAIANVLKHSDATKVLITLENTTKGHFSMLIQDNGTSQKKSYKTTGQGTKNMQKRAGNIHGKLECGFNTDGFFVLLNTV